MENITTITSPSGPLDFKVRWFGAKAISPQKNKTKNNKDEMIKIDEFIPMKEKRLPSETSSR